MAYYIMFEPCKGQELKSPMNFENDDSLKKNESVSYNIYFILLHFSKTGGITKLLDSIRTVKAVWSVSLSYPPPIFLNVTAIVNLSFITVNTI